MSANRLRAARSTNRCKMQVGTAFFLGLPSHMRFCNACMYGTWLLRLAPIGAECMVAEHLSWACPVTWGLGMHGT